MTVIVVVLACLAGGGLIALIAVVGAHSSRSADRYRDTSSGWNSGQYGGHDSTGGPTHNWDSGNHHHDSNCGSGGSSCSSSSCSSSSCGSSCGGGGGGD